MYYILCNNIGVGFVFFFYNYYLIFIFMVFLNDEIIYRDLLSIVDKIFVFKGDGN